MGRYDEEDMIILSAVLADITGLGIGEEEK